METLGLRSFRTLVKGNKEMATDVEELREKCEQAMMLKFGRTVDIDSLGTVTVSRAVEEARLQVQVNHALVFPSF